MEEENRYVNSMLRRVVSGMHMIVKGDKAEGV